MFLGIDAGNTNITFGLFDDKGEIVTIFRMTTKQQLTSDEYGANIINILTAKGQKKEDVTSILIASVVPGIMHSLVNGIKKYFGITPGIVGVGTKTGIRLNMPNPAELGADRIVDLIAGYELYGGPVLVIDFGTATTYDMVSGDGEFICGITSPGIRICANALWNETAKLPEIEIKKPDSILAKTTVPSMQAGLVYGYIGQVEYIVKKVKEESGINDVKVIATGGLGRIIAGETDAIDIYDPELTLKGLYLTHKKQKR